MIWAMLAAMLLPVAAGVFATILPAFGHLPALGMDGFSLDGWRAALAWPGLSRSLGLTVFTGLTATAVSLASALAIAVAARRTTVFRGVQAWIAPILATPHAALAIGVAFLLAPSGWMARVVSPWLSGWTVPPDFATVQDRYGLAMIAGLWLKETPYLLLAIFAGLAQADARASQRVAASLGYGPWRAWALVVLPRLWPQLRLPVMAVLAYALSVVDVALVLGPGNPPTLGVQVLRLLSDPDLSRWPEGCATALLLCAVVALAIVALLLVERLTAGLGRIVARTGRRGGASSALDVAALAGASVLGAASLAALAVLAVWSVTAAWPFASALPTRWSLATWRAQASVLGPLASATAGLGAAATVVAVALAIGGLEHERRAGSGPMRAGTLIYVPLLMPQTAFLFGVQVVLVRLRLDGTWAAVVWAHLVFVLPYVFLALADPFRALDPRYARTAASLGVPPWRVLFRVTLPLLARPLLSACAIGFAVSAGLYLPTLFAGAGRIATLTTEAVTLAAGSDRRILGAAALVQAALPLGVFVLAVAVPSGRARNRRGLAVVA